MKLTYFAPYFTAGVVRLADRAQLTPFQASQALCQTSKRVPFRTSSTEE